MHITRSIVFSAVLSTGCFLWITIGHADPSSAQMRLSSSPPSPSFVERPNPLRPSVAAPSTALSALPARFEMQESVEAQSQASAGFSLRSARYHASIEDSRLMLISGVGAAGEAATSELSWRGANPEARLEGVDSLGFATTAFGGAYPQGRSLAAYRQLRAQNLYAGIDLVYRLKAGRVAYELDLKPFADPSQAILQFGDVDSLTIDTQGQLVVTQGGVTWTHAAPKAFQGAREIEVGFVPRGEHMVGFEITGYDPSLPLHIDPTIELRARVSGSMGDYVQAVGRDGAGNVYVAGRTYSFDLDAEQGSVRARRNFELFVAKLSPELDSVLGVAYVGDAVNQEEDLGDMVVLDDGTVLLAGVASVANAKAPGFPIFPRGADLRESVQEYVRHFFLTALTLPDNEDAEILFSTLLGSPIFHNGTHSWPYLWRQARSAERAFDFCQFTPHEEWEGEDAPNSWFQGTRPAVRLAANDLGQMVLVGYTETDKRLERNRAVFLSDPPFSQDPNGRRYYKNHIAYQISYDDQNLRSPLAIDAGTFLGGSDVEGDPDVALGSDGSVYVAFRTLSQDLFAGILAPPGPKPESNGVDQWDLALYKLDRGLRNVVYGTYLGGVEGEALPQIAVDAQGRAYIAALSNVGNPNPPNADIYLARLSSDGTTLEKEMTWGGSGAEAPTDVFVDDAGDIYLTGSTSSTDLGSGLSCIGSDSFSGPSGGFGPFYAKFDLSDESRSPTAFSYLGPPSGFSEYCGGLAYLTPWSDSTYAYLASNAKLGEADLKYESDHGEFDDVYVAKILSECALPDRDDDGVPDEDDNCPDTPNPEQMDRDGDGIGDVCEEDEERDMGSDAGDDMGVEPIADMTPGYDTGSDANDPDMSSEPVVTPERQLSFSAQGGGCQAVPSPRQPTPISPWLLLSLMGFVFGSFVLKRTTF